ncbi:MAG TPA: BamA/TamA family outer membrane protein [Longimicrobiaceae bacterium]|nr:BamA/TamA family outer membrane protein [Longimicrobiaceae bacterium]
MHTAALRTRRSSPLPGHHHDIDCRRSVAARLTPIRSIVNFTRMQNNFHSSLGLLIRRTFSAMAMLGLVAIGACASNQAGGGPFPRFAEFEGRTVAEVSFAGDLQLSEDSLRAITAVRPPDCSISFIPNAICIFGMDRYRLDLTKLAGDVLRLQLHYRDHGFYGTRVEPSVDPQGSDEVTVRFAIAPGDRVILRELVVEGAEEIIDEAAVAARLPLEVGKPFRRAGFLAAADSIQFELYRNGYAYADILRNYSIDTIADVAEARFVAIPGPLVHVDTILVLGGDRLDRETVVGQLAVREGDVLQRTELNRSQRNLYQLNIISFASVELAADTLQVSDDPGAATVVVRIVEAPKYLANTSLGFGTIDCVRTAARGLDRNFMGGGRSLELTASLSKIGVGTPTNWGLENGLCGALEDDPFSQEMNYRLAADFLQPRLFGTRNQLAANVQSERQSELQAFVRESTGGQVSLSREVGRGALVNTSLSVANGSTRASQAIFCVLFTACSEDDRQVLRDSRWSNVATLSASYDQTPQLLGVSSGYHLRGGLVWSSPALLSDDEYLSLFGEGVAYRTIKPGWVLSGRLQLGEFITGSLGFEEGYIPPERRFYAGGANSVRGFGRNALGPQAFVVQENDQGQPDMNTLQRYPLGGTRVILGSIELRMPSPIFSNHLRAAVFVDAGQLLATGLDVPGSPFQSAESPIVVTPGVGVRITTPVGPIRLDVGFNGYGGISGPLYLAVADPQEGPGDLLLINPDFRQEFDDFLDKFQFQLAVGQAF